MSGSTIQLESFDRFVANNYKKLLLHANCVTRDQETAQDLLHSVYLKIKQRIIQSGYTSLHYLTYFCISLTNTFYSERKAKKNKLKYVQVEDCYNDLEQELLSEHVDWRENEDYYQQTEWLTKKIFEFLETRYNEREIFVFNVYFMMHNERMTYQKISDQTGMSIAYCSQTIKKIKKDLRENLFKTINDNRVRITGVKEIV